MEELGGSRNLAAAKLRLSEKRLVFFLERSNDT